MRVAPAAELSWLSRTGSVSLECVPGSQRGNSRIRLFQSVKRDTSFWNHYSREIIMDQKRLAALTAEVVGAYVANNPVPMSDLPTLIASVSVSIEALGQPVIEPSPQLVPAVNPKRSVYPEYLVSLEDGQRYRSLKRHLRVRYGLTPQQYRERWGLPPDYPMTAPNYAAMRSELAKATGLGRKRAGRPPKKPSGRPRG